MTDDGIIYKELSYKLMGILFKIHRSLGSTYQEKYYQLAIEIALKEEQVLYNREVMIKLQYNGESIGKYYLDLVIDGKIALEVKTVPLIAKEYINQVLAYLDSADLKLGIIANFRTQRLTYKRLVNPKVKI